MVCKLVFVCVYLLMHHSSLDSVQTGATALYVAAQNGHLRAVRADVNIKTNVSHIDVTVH